MLNRFSTLKCTPDLNENVFVFFGKRYLDVNGASSGEDYFNRWCIIYRLTECR
jgi:hypothetical protein